MTNSAIHSHGCTHGPDASGKRCGKPAVTSFVGRDGKTVYYECAEHAINFTGSNYRPGDPVAIHRYGTTYAATVDHITPRGIVMVAFRDNRNKKHVVKYEGA